MFIGVLVDVAVNCTLLILIVSVFACFVFQGGATAGHVACLSSMTQGKVRR